MLFQLRPCLCRLQPGLVVPALGKLSVCVSLRRTISTDWTGFEYKAPGNRETELGLGGQNGHMTVMMFGKEQWQWKNNLTVNEWHSVCLTWSGQARRLRVYINSSFVGEVNPKTSQQLSQNGSLTLGVSHYVSENGEIHPKSGTNLVGEIGLFNIWARELSGEDLRSLSCAGGDVVSWDLKQWDHDCPLEYNSNLHCGKYTVDLNYCMSRETFN